MAKAKKSRSPSKKSVVRDKAEESDTYREVTSRLREDQQINETDDLKSEIIPREEKRLEKALKDRRNAIDV